MSAFENPTIAQAQLCFDDALVVAGYARSFAQRYELRENDAQWASLAADANGRVCTSLRPGTRMVEARVTREGAAKPAATVTFHLRAGATPTLIGIARAPP